MYLCCSFKVQQRMCWYAQSHIMNMLTLKATPSALILLLPLHLRIFGIDGHFYNISNGSRRGGSFTCLAKTRRDADVEIRNRKPHCLAVILYYYTGSRCCVSISTALRGQFAWNLHECVLIFLVAASCGIDDCASAHKLRTQSHRNLKRSKHQACSCHRSIAPFHLHHQASPLSTTHAGSHRRKPPSSAAPFFLTAALGSEFSCTVLWYHL